MLKAKRRLADDEQLLLASVEGWAAFQLLLPLIREAAIYIAGHGAVPPKLAEIPALKSELAWQRLMYRRLAKSEKEG